jgi:hypothetical protein
MAASPARRVCDSEVLAPAYLTAEVPGERVAPRRRPASVGTAALAGERAGGDDHAQAVGRWRSHVGVPGARRAAGCGAGVAGAFVRSSSAPRRHGQRGLLGAGPRDPWHLRRSRPGGRGCPRRDPRLRTDDEDPRVSGSAKVTFTDDCFFGGPKGWEWIACAERPDADGSIDLHARLRVAATRECRQPCHPCHERPTRAARGAQGRHGDGHAAGRPKVHGCRAGAADTSYRVP